MSVSVSISRMTSAVSSDVSDTHSGRMSISRSPDFVFRTAITRSENRNSRAPFFSASKFSAGVTR